MSHAQSYDPMDTPWSLVAAGAEDGADRWSEGTPADFARQRAHLEEELTHLTQAAHQADEERRFLGHILERIPLGIAYHDRDLICRYCNPSHATHLGRPFEQILNRHLSELLPEQPELCQAAQQAIDSGQVPPPHEAAFPAPPEQGQRHFLAHLVPDTDEAGQVQGLLLTLQDITSQKRVEQALRQSEARYKVIVENAIEGVWVLDADGRTTFVNPRLAEMLGYTPEEMRGRSLFDFTDEEHRAHAASSMERLRQGGVDRLDCRFLRKDGSELWALFSARPLFDAEGHYNGALALVIDITARKHGEQLREEYVSLISHDLRNPLTVITGVADWLRLQFARKGDPQAAHSCESIVKSARRMNAMIQDLVDVARLEAGRLEMHKAPLDLAALVREIIERVGTVGERARLHLEAPPSLPTVHADPERLERALVNLITNALKYSPSDRPVVVRLAPQERSVVISVADQGEGIPPEEQGLIFERFYRSRARGKAEGLGLGLYIARLIVEAHGGRIWVESQPGRGSTFSFSLPLEGREAL